MLFVRYIKNKKIVDQEVDMKSAHSVYRHMKKKYYHAELIIKENDTEFCLM